MARDTPSLSRRPTPTDRSPLPNRRPQLFCMESADDTSGPFAHQLVQLVKLHARPRVIYASAKAEPALLEALKAPLAAAAPAPTTAAAPASPGAGEFDVRAERSAIFQLRAARATLEALHVRSMPAGLSTRERMHCLNARLSLAADRQVCAAGALLAVLAREGRLGGGGDGGASAALTVSGVQEVSLDGYLCVDPASRAALQVRGR